MEPQPRRCAMEVAWGGVGAWGLHAAIGRAPSTPSPAATYYGRSVRLRIGNDRGPLLYAASHYTLAAGAARGQDDWLGTISTLGCGLQLLLDDRLVNRLLDGVVLRCLR